MKPKSLYRGSKFFRKFLHFSHIYGEVKSNLNSNLIKLRSNLYQIYTKFLFYDKKKLFIHILLHHPSSHPQLMKFEKTNKFANFFWTSVKAFWLHKVDNIIYFMKPKSLYRRSEKIRKFIGFFEFHQLGVRRGMMEQDMNKELFFIIE